MKVIKNNIEIIIMLFITLYIFVAMFIIYERKIDDYENKVSTLEKKVEGNLIKSEEDVYKLKITIISKINSEYIKISYNEYEDIINLDMRYLKNIEIGKDYYLVIKKISDKNYRFYELQDLIHDNKFIELRGV